MTKLSGQVISLVIVYGLIFLVWRIVSGNTYMVQMPIPQGGIKPEQIVIRMEDDEPPEGTALSGAEASPHLSFEEPEIFDDHLQMKVQPLSAGGTFVKMSQSGGNEWYYTDFEVGHFRTVYDKNTGGFTGDYIIMVVLSLFFLSLAGIFVHYYLSARGVALYSYSTIHAAGFALFALVTGLVCTYQTIRHLMDSYHYPMMRVYSAFSRAGFYFIQATSPILVVFALGLMISNIELLRHERFRKQNILGLIAGAMLMGGMLIAALLYRRDFFGSELELRIHEAVEGVYATVFVYFECILTGAVVCALRAAKHRPAPDKDYIVILGCGFRKDGSLPPLLRGRVDKALEFWHRQKESTGKEAVFIPSGGQGRDETMTEAEAMSRYLLSQGVSQELIAQEDRAANTFQNMQFSRELIEKQWADYQPKAIFSTTNYHVFRSGVWAVKAGFLAEGIGSRTKWWFWPNAFLRECVGLLVARWKQEVLLLVGLVIFFSGLSAVLV